MFFFSSRRRHTRYGRDWSSDVCSSDLEAVREARVEAMREDESVFLMGEDVGVYGGAFGVSGGMVEEFGEERVVDTPLSEAGFVGLCTGAAMMGMRPKIGRASCRERV